MLPEISNDQFSKEVLEASEVVLVDFFSTTCPPCKMLAPILEEISQERKDIKIVKVNTGESPDLAANYSFMSVPTMLLFKAGKVVATWVGLRPKHILLSEIDKALV